MMKRQPANVHGFTLAELLIALAILGIIVAFAIPKVLQSSTDGKKNAMTKELASAVAGAYKVYQLQVGATATTKPADLAPYLNYIKQDTTSVLDSPQQDSSATITCSAAQPCYKFASGATVLLYNGYPFGGTTNTDFIWYMIDLDGRSNGSRTDSMWFCLYYNGRVVSEENLVASSHNNGSTFGPVAGSDPDWFSW